MNQDETLDPGDWESVRRSFHDAVDLAIDHLRDIRAEPVWRPTPERVKERLREALPRRGQSLDRLVALVAQDMLPHGNGNTHPRFFGWVHGAGNAAGALGEMLASLMNSNLGGRDYVANYVERQILLWCKEIFAYPAEASGILTSGTSMGTVIALAAARLAKGGEAVQQQGLAAANKRLVGYASSETHSAIAKAFDLLGLGRDALRLVPVDDQFCLSQRDLAERIAADRIAGFEPAIVIASAGTVNTGAIDDLAATAELCRAQNLWLHVDAAFGGLAILVPAFRARLAAIAQADSIAFDFHKWLQVPYDAGCVLVRDERAHRAAFAARRDYLAPSHRGLAGGDPWFCDYGPELSRGFRALKVWFTIKAHGIDKLAAIIAKNCRQTQLLAHAVSQCDDLELLAPVALNIVCFRFRTADLSAAELDRLNDEIVEELQLRGIAAPSTTRIHGRTAIRVALVNHRTRNEDLTLLVDAVRRLGRECLTARCATRAAQARP